MRTHIVITFKVCDVSRYSGVCFHNVPKQGCAQVVLTLLLLSFLNSHALFAAGTPVFTDTFTANRIDRTRWDAYLQNGATASPGAGLSMSFSSSTGNSQAHLYTFFHLTGDFDVQVDFQLGNNWTTAFPATDPNPQLNGGGLIVYLDQPNWMTIFRGRFANSQSFNFYSNVSLNGSPTSSSLPTTATSGSLRIVSAGGLYSFMVNTGSEWTRVATAPSWNQPVLIGLSGGTVNAHVGFAATLNNFQINSGNTDYQPYELPAEPQARKGFRIGGQFINEVIRRWVDGVGTFQPMSWLNAQGMGVARGCMTTVSDPTLAATPVSQWKTLAWQNSFWSSREMVAQLFKDAMQAGMSVNACYYFSDVAADASAQSVPQAWQGLSLADTATQLEQYAYSSTSYLLNEGITVDLYDVGNETLLGFAGFLPGQNGIAGPVGFNPYYSPSYLSAAIWPNEAVLFNAAIHGIRRADPNARVALHVESTDAPAMDSVFAFFQQMNALGVKYDIAGLSLPYFNVTDLSQFTASEYFQRWNSLSNRIAGLGKAVAIVESNYPWQSSASFLPPMAEFSYTPGGQQAYLASQLAWASNNSNIASWSWFYPEWYPGINGRGEQPNLAFAGLLSDGETLQPAASAMNFNVRNTAAPVTSGVVSAASFDQAPLTPGEIASLFGAELATASDSASSVPLAAMLDGVEVTVGGVPAPLFYVSPTQINFQVPYEAMPGTAAVVVNNGYSRSLAYSTTIASSAPGIFTYGTDLAIVQNANLALNAPDQPAHVGDVVTVYATGAGQVGPPVGTGSSAPVSPLAKPLLPVTATVGGQNAQVVFAGLTPGSVGLFQINIVIPTLAPGNYAIQVTVGAANSNSPSVAIQ
jgi:uncharacterized protein (TIGR03437 family)